VAIRGSSGSTSACAGIDGNTLPNEKTEHEGLPQPPDCSLRAANAARDASLKPEDREGRIEEKRPVKVKQERIPGMKISTGPRPDPEIFSRKPTEG